VALAARSATSPGAQIASCTAGRSLAAVPKRQPRGKTAQEAPGTVHGPTACLRKRASVREVRGGAGSRRNRERPRGSEPLIHRTSRTKASDGQDETADLGNSNTDILRQFFPDGLRRRPVAPSTPIRTPSEGSPKLPQQVTQREPRTSGGRPSIREDPDEGPPWNAAADRLGGPPRARAGMGPGSERRTVARRESSTRDPSMRIARRQSCGGGAWWDSSV